MTVSRVVFTKEIMKMEKAIGIQFDLDKLKQYFAALQVMSDETFIAACREIRISWDRSYFPPVGAIKYARPSIGGSETGEEG